MRGREGPRPQGWEGWGNFTVGAAIEEAAAALHEAAFEDPRRRARWVLAAALALSDTEVFAHPERPLDAAEQERIAAVLGRVLAHEPLSRVVGKREFWGLEFLLSADTLDPRPETEAVVESVLDRLPDRDRPYRFLDLGTGTGCLLLALLFEYPRACGVGVDVAYGAVATARHNAERLGLGDRCRFIAGHWADAVHGRFDAVVANPPYIESAAIAGLPLEVRDHDPRAALDGGSDGLAAYRAIAPDLDRLLTRRGVFATEIAFDQGNAVAAILQRSGLQASEVRLDLAGLGRCVIAERRPAEVKRQKKIGISFGPD